MLLCDVNYVDQTAEQDVCNLIPLITYLCTVSDLDLMCWVDFCDGNGSLGRFLNCKAVVMFGCDVLS